MVQEKGWLLFYSRQIRRKRLVTEQCQLGNSGERVEIFREYSKLFECLHVKFLQANRVEYRNSGSARRESSDFHRVEYFGK